MVLKKPTCAGVIMFIIVSVVFEPELNPAFHGSNAAWALPAAIGKDGKHSNLMSGLLLCQEPADTCQSETQTNRIVTA